MVTAYFVPNALLALPSGVVALLVSYYAFRYGRMANSSFLRTLGSGFMLLGIGLVSQGSVFVLYDLNIGRILDRIRLVYEATIFYLVLQGIAYLLIALGYSRRLQRVEPAQGSAVPSATAAAVATVPLLLGTHIYEFAELIIIILNLVVVFQALVVYMEGRNRFSLLVFCSFALIAFAHFALLISALVQSGATYLSGDAVQLVGFVLLLVFLIRSGRVGSA